MSKKWLPVILAGLAVAVVIALFSGYASSKPDGLETVAEEEGFADKAEDPSYEVIPDYVFPGVENEKVATALAGIVGVAIVAAAMFGLGYVLKATSKNRDGTPTDSAQT
jgi:hypothetical protein